MNAVKKVLTKAQTLTISELLVSKDTRDTRLFNKILDTQTEIDQKIVAKDKARAAEILRDVMRTISSNSVFYIEDTKY